MHRIHINSYNLVEVIHIIHINYSYNSSNSVNFSFTSLTCKAHNDIPYESHDLPLPQEQGGRMNWKGLRDKREKEEGWAQGR